SGPWRTRRGGRRKARRGGGVRGGRPEGGGKGAARPFRARGGGPPPRGGGRGARTTRPAPRRGGAAEGGGRRGGRRGGRACGVAEDGDADTIGRVLGEEALLGGAARAHQLPEAGGVELRAAEPPLAEVREGQVHVVSAEQEVTADGHALDGERGGGAALVP